MAGSSPAMTSFATSSRAKNSAVDFKQAGAALAAADAHGDDAPFGLAPAALLQDVAGEPCAGHPEGMADGDRAAIDVVLLGIDAELVARIQALAGEGFVELPEVDIADLEAVALQQFWHREHRPDTHFVRLATGRRPGDKAPQRLQAALLGVFGFHQYHGCCAIRQLAGIPCGDVFAGTF